MPETARFDKKMRAMRGLVKDRLVKSIERWAERVVKEMRAMLVIQYPAVAAKVALGWTWGDAPRGSITLGSYRGKETAELTVTIYATAKQGSGFSARWFEFGTNPRVQKTTGRATGQITARPFFYPVFRANKGRVQSGLRSTLRRAIRQINAM